MASVLLDRVLVFVAFAGWACGDVAMRYDACLAGFNS